MGPRRLPRTPRTPTDRRMQVSTVLPLDRPGFIEGGTGDVEGGGTVCHRFRIADAFPSRFAGSVCARSRAWQGSLIEQFSFAWRHRHREEGRIAGIRANGAVATRPSNALDSLRQQNLTYDDLYYSYNLVWPPAALSCFWNRSVKVLAPFSFSQSWIRILPAFSGSSLPISSHSRASS